LVGENWVRSSQAASMVAARAACAVLSEVITADIL
jgi:hypothetical protein